MYYIFSKNDDFVGTRAVTANIFNNFPVPRQLGTKLGQDGTKDIESRRLAGGVSKRSALSATMEHRKPNPT